MSDAEARFTIQLLETKLGAAHPMTGQYVQSYDPEVHRPDGSYDGGRLICTRDPAKAGVFDFDSALALWKAGPTCACHRLRADGKPNRPLTAFDVAMERRPV